MNFFSGKIYFFIHLKGRVAGIEGRFFICLFTPQMSTISRYWARTKLRAGNATLTFPMGDRGPSTSAIASVAFLGALTAGSEAEQLGLEPVLRYGIPELQVTA